MAVPFILIAGDAMKSVWKRIWPVSTVTCAWIMIMFADRMFCPWQDKAWHNETTLGILLATAFVVYLLWINHDALRAHVASRLGPNMPARFHKDIKPPLRRPPR